MRIYVITSLSTCLLLFLTALSGPNEKIGHIYKVDVEVAEDLSRRVIDHYNRDGSPVYAGETDYETFSMDQVNEILGSLGNILSENSGNSSMTHEPAKVSGANKFGNIGSNALGKSKMPYFPKAKLKKVKATADVYYQIEIDFLYGGGKGRTIVMDKISKVSTIRFNAKVAVSAYNKAGNKLWEKEHTIRDFSEAFTDPSSPFEVGNKWFEISRAPVLSNGQKEKVGDTPAKNVHTDEFWPLSLEELGTCMEIALAKTIEK